MYECPGMHLCVDVYIYIHMCIYMCIYTYICIHIYIHISIYIYMCLCMYNNKYRMQIQLKQPKLPCACLGTSLRKQPRARLVS